MSGDYRQQLEAEAFGVIAPRADRLYAAPGKGGLYLQRLARQDRALGPRRHNKAFREVMEGIFTMAKTFSTGDEGAHSDAEIADLRAALLAACNYIENATPNLGRKASENYRRAASTYRKIAAGEMRFSDIRD